MSDNVQFQTAAPATAPAATVVETEDQGGGVQRQVVKAQHATTGIGHGHKESTSVGTAVVLAGSTSAKWVTIQAYRSNTGFVAIGATGVLATATAGTGTGLNLAAGESATFPIHNLADIFIDVTISGEGVRYTYGT